MSKFVNEQLKQQVVCGLWQETVFYLSEQFMVGCELKKLKDNLLEMQIELVDD